MTEHIRDLQAHNLAIFDAYFSSRLTEEQLVRARNIFEQTSWFNARGMAMVLDAGRHSGTLDEMLAAIEEIMPLLDEITDSIQRAVAVRRLKDELYLKIVAQGNPMQLFELRRDYEPPESFDAMQD